MDTQEESVVIIYVQNYTGRGTVIKNAKLFKCNYCDYQYHQRQRIIKHKSNCIKRKIIKKLEKSQMVQTERVEVMKKQEESRNSKVEQTELEVLKKRVSQIQIELKSQQHKGTLDAIQTSNYAKKFAEDTFNDIGQLIVNNLKAKFSATVEAALISGIQVAKIKNTICANLINKIQQIKFQEVLFDFSTKLRQAHEELQKNIKANLQSGDITSRTMQNNNRAYSFFCQFEQFNFMYQAKILQEMDKLGNWQKQDYRRYFMVLRDKSFFFSKYPSFPKFQSSKYRRVTPKLSMEEIKQEICNLFNDGKRVLATDIFMVLALGLRKKELLRVYFLTSEKQYCNSIQIRESKNNNVTKRYIPQSLIDMIQHSGVQYPISQRRLANARDHCIENFKTFYGCRHLCITQIISALMKSHEYANFHKSSETTAKFYLNSHDTDFINQAFEIKINKKQSMKPKERKVVIDFTGHAVRQFRIQDKKIQITLQKHSQILPSIEQDSIITKQVDLKEVVLDKSIKPVEKAQIFAKVTAYQKYGVEMNDQLQLSLKCLIDGLSQPSLMQSMCDYMALNGKVNNAHNSLQAVSHILDRQLIYSEFQSESVDPKTIKIFSNQVNEIQEKMAKQVPKGKFSNAIVISKCNQQFCHSATLMPPIKNFITPETNQFFQQKKNKKKYYLFTNQNPKCKCRKGFIWPTIEDCKISFICDFCQKQIDISKQQQKYQNSVEIVFEADQMTIKSEYKALIRDNHKSLQKIERKNNFREIIETKFGPQSYSRRATFTSDIPKFLRTPYCNFSDEIQQQINYNRFHEEYLPLSIASSSIQGAGLGIFANCEIQRNRIILSYMGTISSTFTADLNCDSLFSLGWCMTEPPRQLMICPSHKLNPGRFINSSNQNHQPNCAVAIGILNSNEICIYIYTNEKIPAKKQLLYSYGQNYFKEKIYKKEGDKIMNDQID